MLRPKQCFSGARKQISTFSFPLHGKALILIVYLVTERMISWGLSKDLEKALYTIHSLQVSNVASHLPTCVLCMCAKCWLCQAMVLIGDTKQAKCRGKKVLRYVVINIHSSCVANINKLWHKWDNYTQFITYMEGRQLQHQINVNRREYHFDCSLEERTLCQYISNHSGVPDQFLVQRQLGRQQ